MAEILAPPKPTQEEFKQSVEKFSNPKAEHEQN
jgi:hypothetical protein